jgi:hypothetical protein
LCWRDEISWSRSRRVWLSCTAHGTRHTAFVWARKQWEGRRGTRKPKRRRGLGSGHRHRRVEGRSIGRVRMDARR